MATKYLAKTFKYGALVQTNWATPIAESGAFRTIPYNAGVTVFDPDVKVESHNTSGQNGVHKEFERVYVDGRSGLSKVNFSMPADITTIAPHLGQALLSVSQAGAATYTKTITSGGLTGTIDFNGDDTKLFTVAMEETTEAANNGIVLENAIIENLNLSWDFLANGTARLMQVDGNWIGNEMNFNQNTSGTWVANTFAPMGNTDLFSMSTFTVDGVNWAAQNIRKFTFNVANNVTSSAATTAGKPNNYDVAPVYKSTIIMDFNLTTEEALADFQSGDTVVATLDSSISGGSDGDLTIACTGGILQKQPFIYNGEFAGIELDVLWHSTAAATPVTITLTDSIDWGY
jgi:hypothetical protein